MKSARPIIIAGMPRSGLGLTSAAFFKAGLYLGGPLRPPHGDSLSTHTGRADPDAVERFHDEILSAQAGDEVDKRFPLHPCVPDDFADRATNMIHTHFGDCDAWGWRDARTTLLLDEWDKVLPDARWIFVIRSPAETVWSMLWNKDLNAHVTLPAPRARAALDIWTDYNQRILTFMQKRADHAQIVVVPGDMNGRTQEHLNEAVIGKWQIPIQPVDLAGTYRPHNLKQKSPPWISRLVASDDPAQDIWKSFIALHGANGSTPVVASRSRSKISDHVVCVVAKQKLAYPETFIRDHVHGLPAQVKFLHGQTYPTLTSDELPLRSKWERSLDAFSHEFGVESLWIKRRALCRYLKKENVAVMLAEYGPVGVQVADACGATGIPLVVNFHGYDVSRKGILEAHRESYKKLFEFAAAIIAVSRDMEAQLLAMGVPRERLFYNPCGVDTDMFRGARPENAPPHFLCVGRFVEKKGPHLSLLAFQQAVKSCPDIHLTMVGEGPLRGACEQMVTAMRLTDRVSFLGSRPHEEVAALMRSARCFLQHSLVGTDGNSEGTPVAVSEAGASGLPVVSTLHAGIKEAVIQDESGFLVAEGDVDAMSEKIILLARNPALAALMGGRAREHICNQFSMEKTIGQLWEILETVINKKA